MSIGFSATTASVVIRREAQGGQGLSFHIFCNDEEGSSNLGHFFEDGKVIIPDTAKEKRFEGRVIAVGDGRIKEDGTKIPMEVKKGDRVLFAKYGGTEVKIDGEENLIMKEEDVLCIFS